MGEGGECVVVIVVGTAKRGHTSFSVVEVERKEKKRTAFFVVAVGTLVQVRIFFSLLRRRRLRLRPSDPAPKRGERKRKTTSSKRRGSCG